MTSTPSRSGPRCRATSPASGPCPPWSGRPSAGCSSTSSTGAGSSSSTSRWAGIAAWVLLPKFHEKVERRAAPDRLRRRGAAHRSVATLLILGLLEGGVLWAWWSAPSVVILGCPRPSAGGLRPRRAAGRRAGAARPGSCAAGCSTATNLASLAVGVILIGLTSYVPLYVQAVLGTNALVAGLRARRADHRLADRRLHWPAGSTCGSASATRR